MEEGARAAAEGRAAEATAAEASKAAEEGAEASLGEADERRDLEGALEPAGPPWEGLIFCAHAEARA